MTKMFKLKKGNPKNLEGRVLIYAHNLSGIKDSHENPKYPAIYAAGSAECLAQFKAGLNDFEKEEEFEKILESTKEKESAFEEFTKEIQRKFPEIMPQIEMRLYLISTRITDLDHAMRVEADILYAGEIDHIRKSDRLMGCLAQAYMINYSSQLERRKREEKAKAEKPAEPVKSWRDYNASGLTEEICQGAGRLMDYTREKREAEENEQKTKLRELVRDSPYKEDIEAILNLTKEKVTSKNLTLVSCFIKKIGAIHEENYEQAAKLRDEIQRLFYEKSE